MLTVKELMKKLNPHFNNCKAVYFYDEEEINCENIKKYENIIIKNYYIEPCNYYLIRVDIE